MGPNSLTERDLVALERVLEDFKRLIKTLKDESLRANYFADASEGARVLDKMRENT